MLQLCFLRFSAPPKAELPDFLAPIRRDVFFKQGTRIVPTRTPKIDFLQYAQNPAPPFSTAAPRPVPGQRKYHNLSETCTNPAISGTKCTFYVQERLFLILKNNASEKPPVRVAAKRSSLRPLRRNAQQKTKNQTRLS